VRHLVATAALLAALPAAGQQRARDAFEEDFEPERPTTSIAFGPAPNKAAIVSADLGWLRSAVRADLALAGGFDFVVQGDAFLLHGLFGGQDAISAGLRWSGSALGPRVSLEIDGGIVYFAGQPFDSSFFLRGEANLGWEIPAIATPYVRASFRALRASQLSYEAWSYDQEFGVGVEHAFGKNVVGVEIFTWAQPGLSGLGQWRLRVGHAF
jgi:hypothetical protein